MPSGAPPDRGPRSAGTSIRLSVVLPAYNEEECIVPILTELFDVLDALTPMPFEVLAVNDGSTDRTGARLREMAARRGELRVFTLTPNAGQSAAMGVAFRALRGEVVVTLDADGQNDPADLPRLVDSLDRFDVCCGYRRRRRDTAAKRIGSRLANAVRRTWLKDDIIDTGCTLKAFRSWVVRDLQMWKGMHRFLPMLARMKGATITQIPVHHRSRSAGTSKYTNLGRLRQTLWDVWAVRWMQRRNPRFEAVEEIIGKTMG